MCVVACVLGGWDNCASPHAAEFRDGARLTDAAKIAAGVEVAARGLDTMKKYTSLDRRASHWQVRLEEDPLGQAASEQRRAEEMYKARQAATPSAAGGARTLK